MQKVERRKQRNSRKWIWLAASLVLLAGSVTAAVLLTRPAEKIPGRESRAGMLVSRKTEELVSLTVERRGEEPWTLVRTEDGELMPEGGGEWTVAQQQGEILQESVTQLRYEEILTEEGDIWKADPAQFGLEPPLVTVTARYTDGEQITLHIGDDAGLEENCRYMTLEGDDRLFALSAAVADDLNMEYELLHPVPRPEIYEALLDRITVTDGEGGIIAEWMLAGGITDRDAGDNWILSAPFTYPADEEAIASLKKSAGNLRLGVYTAPATAEELARCGLETPARIVTFHMAAGSTGTVSDSGVYDITDHEERTVALQIGGSPDELADYVRFGDEIFTVSHFTLSVFSDPDPWNSVARYPVITPLDSLESMTVEENGETRTYELQEAEDSGETGETRVCLLNGEKTEYAAFQAAYERLLTVTFSGILPEGAVWEEPYKIYTFHTLSGRTHTVTLSNWDGMHDAVTVDGFTLFYLIRGGMTPLPE